MARAILIFTILIFYCSSSPAQDTSLKGTVTDSEGNPLPGAGISVEGTYIGVQSGAEGNFILEGLKPGSYILQCSFIGYETVTKTISLPQDSKVDFVMVQKPLLTREVIVSATRAGLHSPIAFTNIGSEAIREQNIGQDIPYLLSLAPSVVETSESGNGIGYTSLRIRGSDASRINVTIDGIPLNDAESQQVFWVDMPDLASSVDNIQIQRGVGTSASGAGAFGATINIQTKSHEEEPYTELITSAGSFGTLKTVISAGTGLINNKFAFQTRFSDIRSNGYVDRTGSRHRSGYFSGIYRSGKSLLKANLILGQEHTGIGWWGVPPDSLASNRTYNPAGEYTDENGKIRYYNNESDNYTQNHYQLIYSLNINSNLSLNTALHYTFGKGYYEEFKEDASYEDYGLPQLTLGNSALDKSDLIRQKWLLNDFYGFVWSLKYNKNKLDASLGGGMNLYSGDHYGNIIWMKYAGSTPKDYRWYINNGEKSEASIYGKMNWSFSQTVSIFGDMQYRHIKYDMAGPDDDLKDLTQTHNFNFFNPKAGIFLKLTPYQDAYLSFSVANREPSRADFKEASGDPRATPRPETLYDTELGYKLRSGKAAFGVNLYAMYYSDQLVPTGELSNVGYPIMTNVDKSHRIGAEFTAGFKPASFIDWAFNLTVSENKIQNFTEYYIDYSTNDWSEEYKSRYHGTVDIAYSPSVTGSSDIGFRLSRAGELHFISKYVSSQYFDNTMSRDRMIDPYFTSAIRVDFQPQVRKLKGLGFQLLINNIFNSLYESNAYGGNYYEDGVEKTWSYYFPQAGRNFMVRAEIKF
jgi:iron complex outermembrane receptor protein